MGQNFSTRLGIAQFPEIDQAKYPTIFADALRVRQALTILQGALDTYTGATGADPANWSQLDPMSWDRLANLTRTYVQATEAIAAGATVNFYNNSGTIAARNANAAAGKPAHAYANAAVVSGAWGEFIRQGACKIISGLTVGATYYQSNTNGLITPTAPAIKQVVGYAMSPTTLVFQPTII